MCSSSMPRPRSRVWPRSAKRGCRWRSPRAELGKYVPPSSPAAQVRPSSPAAQVRPSSPGRPAPASELLGLGRVLTVAPALVEGVDLAHLVIGQGEAEDVQVL